MSDKRYEMSAIFHSGKSEDELITELFELLGTSAALSIQEISDDPLEVQPTGLQTER